MQKKCIVYVAINNQEFIQQMLVSIRSLLRNTNYNSDLYRIVVYTDSCKWIQEQRNLIQYVTIIEVNSELKQAWLNHKRYIYDIKICALIDCLERYNETTILIDTDTFFMKSIESLFHHLEEDNCFLMNYKENDVEQLRQPHVKLENAGMLFFIENIIMNNGIVTSSSKYIINNQTEFWNSGVIGVKPEHRDLLNEALQLSRWIIENVPIRTSEQIALSIVFQKYGKIKSSGDTVFHYWFLKEALYLLEIYYEMTSVIEPRYVNSPILKEIQRLQGSINIIDIPRTILKLAKQLSPLHYRNLFNVMDYSSYLGQLLRKNN